MEPTYYFKWSVPSLPCRVPAQFRLRLWIHFVVGTKSFIRIIYSSCLMTSLCGAKNRPGGAAAFALLMETSGGKHTCTSCTRRGRSVPLTAVVFLRVWITHVVFLSRICRTYCKVIVLLSAFIPSRHIFMFATHHVCNCVLGGTCLHLCVSYTSAWLSKWSSCFEFLRCIVSALRTCFIQ